MKPYYKDNHDTLYCQDFRQNDLPDESVQCVVTSPPYWGLRKYSGEQELIWGDKDCEHQWVEHQEQAEGYTGTLRWVHGDTGRAYQKDGQSHAKNRKDNPEAWSKDIRKYGFCSLCGAWKGAYGLEPTPEMYIEHTIEILREIRRVLRKDGVVFWNIGDSYWGGTGHKAGETNPGKEYYTKDTDNFGSVNKSSHNTLKPKDLCLIPFKVAIAAQEDGWWVRSVFIWDKPNPMPESVTDRPTNSHEYILMLTKSKKYYWDADAVRTKTGNEATWEEYAAGDGHKAPSGTLEEGVNAGFGSKKDAFTHPSGRNIRSVWEFPTQPYPEAHFAVFPEKLPEICIKAATPEVGCCSKCGAPWERISEVQYQNQSKTETEKYAKPTFGTKVTFGRGNSKHQTLGWQPTCKCNADKVPSVVLDPFSGAGTTLWMAKTLNRQAIGYEISEEYCRLAAERCRQQVLM